jgi:hypothetical protein
MRTFTSRAVALGCTATLVALVACGDDDPSAGAGTPNDATMSALSETFCQKLSECTSDFAMQIAYGSLDGCKARFKAQLQLDIKSAGYGVTDIGANSCLTALKGVACTDLLDNKTPDACKFKGSLADGSNCTADAECQSGSCFIDDAAACGKCGPRTGAGADCTNSQCDYGLKCNATKLCTNGALGASCTKDTDCHAFTQCRGGVCTALLEEGAACKTKPGANDASCNILKGLFCLPKNLLDPDGTCTKVSISFVGAGEKCGFKSLNPPAATACTNAECTNEVCVPHVADGAPCTGVEGQPKCEEPAKCRAGVCSLKDSTKCK